jgi:sec-independent protein translocase protein TatA
VIEYLKKLYTWKMLHQRRIAARREAVDMDLHFLDILVLLVLGLLIFGPKRLPELGTQVGRAIREFQHMLRDDQPSTPPSQATAEDNELPRPTTQESVAGEPHQD